MFEANIGSDGEYSSSFTDLSIPDFALREYWLAVRSEAGFQSPQRLNRRPSVRVIRGRRGGQSSGIRAVWTERYILATSSEKLALVHLRSVASLRGHIQGENIRVLVNRANPRESYFPSGFEMIEPIIFGIVDVSITVLLVFWFIDTIVSAIN